MTTMSVRSWRKSSRSASSSSQCVEVGCAHDAKAWRKSSRSGSTSSQCVEVTGVERIAMRDSKDTAGDFPYLTLSPQSWTALLADIRTGHFDG